MPGWGAATSAPHPAARVGPARATYDGPPRDAGPTIRRPTACVHGTRRQEAAPDRGVDRGRRGVQFVVEVGERRDHTLDHGVERRSGDHLAGHYHADHQVVQRVERQQLLRPRRATTRPRSTTTRASRPKTPGRPQGALREARACARAGGRDRAERDQERLRDLRRPRSRRSTPRSPPRSTTSRTSTRRSWPGSNTPQLETGARQHRAVLHAGLPHHDRRPTSTTSGRPLRTGRR